MYGDQSKELLGKKINKIFINGEYLKFETDKGDVYFQVEGDCCSHSYFYDFEGVERLLNNGEVKSFEEIPDMPQPKQPEYDAIAAYGYRITTEDKKFGEVSSVLSFRNESNGYYGGSMELTDSIPATEEMQEIKKDWKCDELKV